MGVVSWTFDIPIKVDIRFEMPSYTIIYNQNPKPDLLLHWPGFLSHTQSEYITIHNHKNYTPDLSLTSPFAHSRCFQADWCFICAGSRAESGLPGAGHAGGMGTHYPAPWHHGAGISTESFTTKIWLALVGKYSICGASGYEILQNCLILENQHPM